MNKYEEMKRSMARNELTIQTAKKHLTALDADLRPEDDLVIRNRIWNAMDSEMEVLRRAESRNATIIHQYAGAIKEMLKNKNLCITVTSCSELKWRGRDHAMVDEILEDGTVKAHNCRGERYVLRMGDNFAPYKW